MKNDKTMTAYTTCFTYKENQETEICCGASGRKFRRVCRFCPNYERWEQQKKKEGEDNGNESQNVR